MRTRTRIRLRVLAASAVLAAGLAPLLPSTAVADAPQETVVPATLRDYPLTATFRSSSTGNGHDAAGAQGVFHTMEGRSGLLWTRYADGESVSVPAAPAGTAAATTGTDVLAYKYSDGRVDFWDATDGTRATLRVPAGLGYLTSYDDLTIGYRNVTAEDGTATREMRLLTPGPDGTTGDVTVTGGPAGLVLGQAAGADSGMLYFRASVAGEPGLAAVDRASGEVRGWSGPLPVSYSRVALGGGRVVVSALDKATVLVLPRDLSTAPVEVRLAGAGDGANATSNLAVVGDWLVNGASATTAQPLAGGEPVTLLASSQSGVAIGPDGTAVKVGTGTGERGIQRLTPGADGGAPVVTLVKPLPKPPLRIQGISLEQGRLVVTDSSGTVQRNDYVRTVAVTGTPAFGERSPFTPSSLAIARCGSAEIGCEPIFGTADGRIAWLEQQGENNVLRVNGPTEAGLWERQVYYEGRIVDVSGRYIMYADPGQRQVYKIDDQGDAVATAVGAAALDADVLWTTGRTAGTVTALNLSTKKSTTVTTDAGCKPTELQALGRYLYWTCDNRAGVYDRTAKKSVAVPAGEAKLGDGYVVTHDKQAGKLTLTTVAGGTAASRVVGDLPDTGASQRDVRWTVDESGANAAYVDDREQVHLVPSGVPQQPLSLLAPAAKSASVKARTRDTVPDTLATLLLSKPSASWRLTVRDRATGKAVDTRTGGAARGELSVGWAGTDAEGTFLPNGSYDWTLSVAPADGVGAPLAVTGTVALRGGAAARHDHLAGDGIGDLLTLNGSGGLTFHQGTGKGTFSGKVTGSGWPTTARFVSYGDLSGDRCNDVLVRYSSGALRLFKPGCGAALKPSTSYTTLGTSGWTQYDVLTAPGDVNKDGLPDLIARNSSTGTVYLYKGTSTGKLAPRVKLYDNWKTYKKVVGAGDLNGDGVGDLLAQDKSDNLYRYYGTGNGAFGTRVKIATGWGASYNAVVGAGDITGDGKSDLVMRDTAGNLYRQTGNSKGSFAARMKIATGWQGYKGIF
ncbi:FG-GAP-like repeat-containing protein [Streptomyces blattellae]|uniref:FG-GAP-like repeat-containing protein n=1 Tax=Streptomyces blattellae TaxID=2569855 RepID=UPI0012B6C4D5|nr:FG-GAP-like repeat-containing protein [Streptomyces blattellae]